MKTREVLDANPVAREGEDVWFHSPGERPRAAKVGNVDVEGGPADLVVFCLGDSSQKGTRGAWARGHSVVVFKGSIEHVSHARTRNLPLYWSHVREDCLET